MNNPKHLSRKEELILILQESIEHLQNIPDKTIDKREIRMNTDKGTGYYFSDDKFHLWLVKFYFFFQPGKILFHFTD